MKAIFFFAHQDDEFGVLSSIEKHVLDKDDVSCIYVTDGGETATPEIRNLESLSVLAKLGVKEEKVMFLGQKLKLHDGRLHEKVIELGEWLDKFFQSNSDICFCYFPALEGGHPDHDILHTATVVALEKVGKISMGRQYPLYNSWKMPAPFFKVLSPLPDNGPAAEHPLTFKQKYRYFSYCFYYKSQWKTWIGLAPFVFIHLFFHGRYYLQEASMDRLFQRPHDGQLYFETRKFLSWYEFMEAIKLIVKR